MKDYYKEFCSKCKHKGIKPTEAPLQKKRRMKMINRIKRWWYWQKVCDDNFFYKILVLLGIQLSPTFNYLFTPDGTKIFHEKEGL